MIDLTKTLDEALKNIDFRQVVVSPVGAGERGWIIDKNGLYDSLRLIGELYETVGWNDGWKDLTWSELSMLYTSHGSGVPVIDFADFIHGNVLSAGNNDCYHLRLGLNGYIFGADIDYSKPEHEAKSVKRQPIFDAVAEQNEMKSWERSTAKNAVIFVDCPPAASRVYFMRVLCPLTVLVGRGPYTEIVGDSYDGLAPRWNPDPQHMATLLGMPLPIGKDDYNRLMLDHRPRAAGQAAPGEFVVVEVHSPASTRRPSGKRLAMFKQFVCDDTLDILDSNIRYRCQTGCGYRICEEVASSDALQIVLHGSEYEKVLNDVRELHAIYSAKKVRG